MRGTVRWLLSTLGDVDHLIDAPDSKVGRLEELLVDKGLEHIAVWNFPLD
jgi:hypothetical protein